MPHVSPRSRLARRALICVGSLAGAGLLAWGVYALAQLGPKDAAETAAAEASAGWSAPPRELAAEVAAIEARLRDGPAPLPEALRATSLERAIALQRQLVAMARHPRRKEMERLDRLERERDTLATEAKRERSAELEQVAAAEQQAGRSEVAAARWREALALQQEINRSRAAEKAKDFVRETRLALQLEAAEAMPLRRRLEAALARAEAAGQRQDWPEALAARRDALAAVMELNQRGPNSRLTDLSLQGALTKEVAAWEAAGAAAEIEAREKDGDAAAAAGQPARAAEFYQTAIEAQVEANRRYAGSRFASTRRAEELEVKRQTVLAEEAWRQVRAHDEMVRELLGKRQVANASRRIAEAAAWLEKIETTWPKSRAVDGALKLKLAFLARHRDALRALQDDVYGQLLPVPNEPSWLMLRTEVTQELYAKLMRTNPSRNVGRRLPVDSVDWAGAQEFCARLSWVLGVTTRLPTERTFRQARGRGAMHAWTADNSSGRSHEAIGQQANENGFCDLAGNLAEWLQAAPDSATAPVAGGSYLEARTVVEAAGTVAMEKATRARHIGFRVVVEYPLR